MNKKWLLIVFTCIFIMTNSVSFAIGERRLDDLQISSDIEVNDYNKNAILNTPKVDETEKVYDFADLFTSIEEDNLYSEITDFISETNLDMAIVTIDNNPKNSAMAYADDFYDYNYFGTGTTHDGLLFLIDMDTREMWLSTTGIAQLMYDDSRINNILDITYEEIVDKDYYGCAYSFIDKSGYYFRLGIPASNKNVGINEDGDYIYYGYESSESFSDLFLGSLIFSFIIALVIVLVMKSRHKTVKKSTNAWAYMHSPSITMREDYFLTTNTTRVYIPPASSSGGGSSTHRSSSGRNHGGGGRRF